MEVVNIISSWQGFVGLFLGGFFGFTILIIFLMYLLFALHSKTKEGRRQDCYRALLMFLVCIWMGILLIPSFFEFSKVEIQQNGTWKLKNGFSITLKTLSPEEPRTIKVFTKKVFWYGGSQRQFNAANVYVITDKKIYGSFSDLPDSINNSAQKLEESIAKYHLPESNNTDSPIKFVQILQQIKYLIYGLLVLALLIPEILKKIWPKKKIK